MTFVHSAEQKLLPVLHFFCDSFIPAWNQSSKLQANFAQPKRALEVVRL
jgi:hypothetical protein